MSIHPDSLSKLPIGASFQVKNDRVTATITRQESDYAFLANCDSLTVFITELQTEIYHLNKEKTDFKTSLKEEKIIEVNRLTGWQYFQIWSGRIALSLLACFLGYQLLKIKFKKI